MSYKSKVDTQTSVSSKTEEEIQCAVLEYLQRKKCLQASENFVLEAKLPFPQLQDGVEFDSITNDSRFYKLVERKWLLGIRLQRRCNDLENKLGVLRKQCQNLDIKVKAEQSKILLPDAPSVGTLSSHQKPVTSIAFHPIYTVVATASEDSSIKIWDYESMQLERTLKNHTNSVNDLTFSPSGDLLASGANDNVLKLFDVKNGYQFIRNLSGHSHSVTSVKFTPSGEHIISAGRDGTIRIWEAASGYCVRSIQSGSEWVRTASPSSDGQLILSGCNDHRVRIHEFNTGTCILDIVAHENVVERVTFAPESAYPYIKKLCSDQLDDNIPDTPGQFFFTCSRDKLIKLFTINGKCIYKLSIHDSWVRNIVIHSSGQYLFSAADDRKVKVIEIMSGRTVRTLLGHNAFVTCLALTPRSHLLASGSTDLGVRIWKCK